MATRVAGKARAGHKKKSPRWVKYLKRTLCLGLIVFFLGGSAVGFLVISEMRVASERIQSLYTKLGLISESSPSRIFAADRKTLLYTASPVYRKPIAKYEDIPELVIHATLAAEDKRFFSHSGVDYWAAGRSVVTNIRDRRASHGGSTITMQLAKRLYTSSEKTWQRKLSDVCMAIQIERTISKKEILRHYLNEIFYGQGAYGINAAAQVYFGKGLKDLTVSEAATLARLVRRPSEENPFVDKEKAIENRNVVLKVMREEGWITEEQYGKAKSQGLNLKQATFASGDRVVSSPYFTHYVLDYLKDNYPDIDLKQGGYTIYTTLDVSLQKEAEKSVASVVRQYRRGGVKTGAFVLMDNTGQILAMQGGLDYQRNQFNAVTQGGRQPGSSFKPFVYSAALSVGAIAPGDRISNEPFEMPIGNGRYWRPKNSNGSIGGSYPISTCIAQSPNIPAVWVTSKVGPDVAAKYARDVFGFHSKIEPVMSMALGTNDVNLLEMAEAYSVFMSAGDRVQPRPITRIDGPNRETLYTVKPTIFAHQLDSQVASLMDGYMRQTVTSGTARRAQVVKEARGKTGTTQDNRDAWFCGYTNNMVGIAWIANEQFDEKKKSWVYPPMSSSIFGGSHAIYIWNPVMKAAQAKYGVGKKIETPALSRDIGLSVTQRKQEPDETVDETPVRPPQDQREPDPVVEPVREPERTTPPPVQEEPPKREERTRPLEDSVTVDICAASGLKANIYCPETNSRSFAAGQAPKRWCRVHGN